MYGRGMGGLGQGGTDTPTPQATPPSWYDKLINFGAAAFDSGINVLAQTKQAKDAANAQAAAQVAIARAQLSSQAATRFKVTPMMIGVGVGAVALVAVLAMRRR